MPGVETLSAEDVRDALRAFGEDEATVVSGSTRVLRDRLNAPGFVQGLLDRAPSGAGEAFRRLALDGAASVEDLLGRGWAGRGTLPEPLDWLQRRALVTVGREGLVHAVDEARHGYAEMTFDLTEGLPAEDPTPLLVEAAATVVVAPNQAALDRAVAVAGAALRMVSTTVAVSDRRPEVVQAALESAGAPVSGAEGVTATGGMPMPGLEEEAYTPKAMRALLRRALEEERQIRLEYFASSRGGAATERVVDPWTFADDLLRGWCHLRDGERTFAVDRIGSVRLLTSGLTHPAKAS